MLFNIKFTSCNYSWNWINFVLEKKARLIYFWKFTYCDDWHMRLSMSTWILLRLHTQGIKINLTYHIIQPLAMHKMTKWKWKAFAMINFCWNCRYIYHNQSNVSYSNSGKWRPWQNAHEGCVQILVLVWEIGVGFGQDFSFKFWFELDSRCEWYFEYHVCTLKMGMFDRSGCM